MDNSIFSRIFGNSNQSKAASKASKKRRGRQCRIEELESREMLAAMFGQDAEISGTTAPDLNGSVTWVETSTYKSKFNEYIGENSPSNLNQAQYKYLAALFNDDLKDYSGDDPAFPGFGGVVQWSKDKVGGVHVVTGLDFTKIPEKDDDPVVDFSKFTTLDLSVFTSLKEITLTGTNDSDEKIGLTNLETLNVSGTQLEISGIKGTADVEKNLGITGLAGEAAPTNVTAALTNDGKVIVSWTQAWDAEDYIVQYRIVGTEEWGDANRDDSATEDLGLQLRQRAVVVSQPEVAVANNIEFRVLAVKKINVADSAPVKVNIASAKTAILALKDVDPSKDITGTFRVSAVKGDATTGSVTLNLNTHGSQPIQGVLYYEITCTSHPELGKFYVAATGQGQKFTIEGLKANTNYRFNIVVHGENGQPLGKKHSDGTPRGTNVSAKTLKPAKGSELAKAIPTGIRSAAGINSVTLTGLQPNTTYSIDVWQTGGNGNDRGYKFTVEVTVDSDGYATIGGEKMSEKNKVTISGLKENGIKHQFRVSQVMPDGQLSQARHVNGSTVKLNIAGNFPAVRGVKIEGRSQTEIKFSFNVSPVHEVVAPQEVGVNKLQLANGYIDFGSYRIGLWGSASSFNFDTTRLSSAEAVLNINNGRITVTIKAKDGSSFTDMNLGIQAVSTVVRDGSPIVSSIARAKVKI